MGLALQMSVWWTDEHDALRIYDEVRCELCCSVHSSMHNTTVLVLALRMINGIHHTLTMRCVHDCIYLSLCMHCARYGAREGRARSEMKEALPGFCRRTHMPVANRFSQAASYTRTWRHGDMLSYSRKIKLASHLVHRHVLRCRVSAKALGG